MEKWPYSRANFQKFLFKILAREYSHFANIRARIFKNLRFFDGFQRTLRMWWRGDSMRGNFFQLHMISFNHPWTYFVKKTWIRFWKFFAKMYKLFGLEKLCWNHYCKSKQSVKMDEKSRVLTVLINLLLLFTVSEIQHRNYHYHT